jgi:UDP-N-acetylmuramoyl-tripeptide--D-alanyl-D-alanine ligase
VGITGSNGKTTVKELIAAILGRAAPTLATRGNLNNEIGMPLTLLELGDQAYGVIEMGANHAGEISRLSRIAQPDLALLNNAGRAHLEGFGSVEGVAWAKGEIVEGLNSDGTFIFNADDAWADYWRGLEGPWRRIGFGMEAGEVRGEELADGRLAIRCPDWRIELRPGLDGRHNRMNMVAAAAAAWALGIDTDTIRAGLESAAPVRGRLQPLAGLHGSRLIDDSYNGNPDSVAAAIRYLGEQPGQRILVLGELAELGDGVDGVYQELGQQARAAGLDGLWAVAPAEPAARAFGEGGQAFRDINTLLAAARQAVSADHRVLVKGSRRAGMERVVAGLSSDQQAGEAN